MLVSAQGVLLERTEPPRDGPRVKLAATGRRPGDMIEGPAALAALEFLAALPIDVSTGAVVTGEEGNLWARIGGHKVILGSSSDMKAKAASLAALIEQGVPSGSRINLVAPDFPSVRGEQPEANPQPEVEGADGASTEASG